MGACPDHVRFTLNSGHYPQLADVIEPYRKLAGWANLDRLRAQRASATGRKDFDKFLTARTKKVLANRPTQAIMTLRGQALRVAPNLGFYRNGDPGDLGCRASRG